MMVVGLTGGIGSGKTTVAKFFTQLGVPVYNSDLEARRLLNSSGELRKAIVTLLGPEAYDGEAINRPYVAELVFKDPELLQAMNAEVHPRVRAHFKEWAREQQYPYVIQEAAILFENGAYEYFDAMILVRAPEGQRIERLKKRDGSTEEAIRDRMSHQWDDARKSTLAHYIIDNEDLVKTEKKVRAIHRELLEKSGNSAF